MYLKHLTIAFKSAVWATRTRFVGYIDLSQGFHGKDAWCRSALVPDSRRLNVDCGWYIAHPRRSVPLISSTRTGVTDRAMFFYGSLLALPNRKRQRWSYPTSSTMRNYQSYRRAELLVPRAPPSAHKNIVSVFGILYKQISTIFELIFRVSLKCTFGVRRI